MKQTETIKAKDLTEGMVTSVGAVTAIIPAEDFDILPFGMLSGDVMLYTGGVPETGQPRELWIIPGSATVEIQQKIA